MPKPPTKNKRPPIKRIARPHKLGQSLDKVTAPIFKKRGLAATKIIADWHMVVGDIYATLSHPKKIVFPRGKHTNGTLYIEVSDSATAMQLTAISPIILERIASYIGAQSIDHIKCVHNPTLLPKRPTSPVKQAKLSPAQEKQLSTLLDDVEDEELRAVLQSLGNAVLGGA